MRPEIDLPACETLVTLPVGCKGQVRHLGMPRNAQGCSTNSDVSVCVMGSELASKEARHLGGLWERGDHSLNRKTHTGYLV